MTEPADRRADTTRQQILRAAAYQFARRPYHAVGLDDILNVAELTKGAMYFHFRSKHALALAVIEQQVAKRRAALQDLLGRGLSGLETLIDASYRTVVADINWDASRAVLRLLPAVGWVDGLLARLLGEWVEMMSPVIKRAIAEGDVVEEREPEAVAHVLAALHLGLQGSGNLDEPEQFLRQLEKCWATVLPGIVSADRIDYFTQFTRRRTALAIRSTSAGTDGAGS